MRSAVKDEEEINSDDNLTKDWGERKKRGYGELGRCALLTSSAKFSSAAEQSQSRLNFRPPRAS